MADVATVLSKVRALGADIMLDKGKMTIVGSVHLNGEQRDYIAKHREPIEQFLRAAAESLPPQSENDTPPLTWGQTARILYDGCPEGRDACDWSYFVTEMGKVMREHFGVEA